MNSGATIKSLRYFLTSDRYIAVALMLRLRRGKAEQLHCVVELLDPPLLLQYTWN